MPMLPDRTRSLAILGGRSAFAQPRHVGAPNIGDRRRFYRRLDEVLDRGRLSNRGPLVQQFEQEVAARAGVKHCVAMCNGTTALQIAASALGLSAEVIVPSFTFVATAHALKWQGIQPVFADIDPRTHNLNASSVESLITPRTTGILGVHLWGRPGPVVDLQDIADRHNLALFFDAAHAFGCKHGGQPVGSFGRCEIFSFHATKFVNTGEGGAVVTDDDGLARCLRLQQNFGFTGLDQVESLGVNGKMSELAAALGLTSLEGMTAWMARAREVHDAWGEALAPLPGLSLLTPEPGDDSNYQYLAVEVDDGESGLSRDLIVQALRAENILARRYFHPGCHRMEPYVSEPPPGGYHLPATEHICRRIMVLPAGAAVTPADVRRMGEALAAILASGPAIRNALTDSPARKECKA